MIKLHQEWEITWKLIFPLIKYKEELKQENGVYSKLMGEKMSIYTNQINNYYTVHRDDKNIFQIFFVE